MNSGPNQGPLIDERLSAWLDDELPAGELELLATRLSRSPEHQARVARYSLIGSALRGGRSGTLTAELAALRLSGRVRDALDELAGSATARHSELGRGRRLLPYALAAGLALVAVALVPLLRLADGGPGPGAGPGPGPSLAAVPVATNRHASLSPTRLTNYLVYHGEYSGTLSAKLTDSRIVNQPAYVVAVPVTDRLPDR